MRPSAEGWYRFEGEAHININSAGFRGPEFSREKPAGVYRIAVIGDSFTVGLDVPDEKTFIHVLETRLAGCGVLQGKKIQVLNFGVGGYGTTQELILLRKRALAFHPDMVLLMFFSGNDVSDNSREARQYMANEAPFLVPAANGEWQLDESFRTRRGLWLDYGSAVIYRSRLLQVANQVRKVIGLRREHGRNFQTAHREDDPNDPVMEDAWRATDQSITLIQDECKNAGVDFMVGIIPIPGVVKPGSDVSKGDERLVYIDRRFEAICGKKGIEALLLFPALARYANGHNAYVCGFPKTLMGQGHWNEVGHLVAGEALAEAICKRVSRQR